MALPPAVITELEEDPNVVYVLDEHLRIEYCNRAWDEFAKANGGAGFVRSIVAGTALLDYFRGPLRLYYQNVLERLVMNRLTFEQSDECSSPQLFRLFRMHIMPIPASRSVLVVNSLQIEARHDREESKLGLEAYRDENGLITICSNCRRALRAGESRVWDWAPALLEQDPATISHGLCSPCVVYCYGSELQP